MKIARRPFMLASALAAAAAALGWKVSSQRASAAVPGKILGASSSLGHRLRDGGFPEPASHIETDVVIVGGGIAGLAAGYRLQREGHSDFIVLDMEKQTGGNSTSGKNDVSAYPWGAHYVPLLAEESKAVRSLFEDLGVITGQDDAGRPIYNDYYISAEPLERLFILGRWQDGLIPITGISNEDDRQYKLFFAFVESLKQRKGHDGKKLFAIPLDLSSQDEAWIRLDRMSMTEWMSQNGYTSDYLKWYVDYACRDDFGTPAQETSAWAGLHYFAARSGVAANTDSSSVITWPEGNGWLAAKLAEPLAGKVTTQSLVYDIARVDEGVKIKVFDEVSGTSKSVLARAAIVATPHFISHRMLAGESASGFSYSPWAVANITLSSLPMGKGAPLSWDNVVYKSSLLGYVVATHQIPQMTPVKTVITYYWPLSHLPPGEARKEAISRTHLDWQNLFLTELLAVHPELDGKVEAIDVWVWGHAMVRPTPGFIWGEARHQALQQRPPIFTAHSDMSGISIFEEAYTHGVRAAENAMVHLGRPFRSVL